MQTFKKMLVEGDEIQKWVGTHDIVPHKLWVPDGVKPKARLERLIQPDPTSSDPEHAALQDRLHSYVQHAFDNDNIRVPRTEKRGGVLKTVPSKMSGAVKDCAHIAINGGTHDDIRRILPPDTDTPPQQMVSRARFFIAKAQEHMGVENPIQLGPLTRSLTVGADTRTNFPGGIGIRQHLDRVVKPEHKTSMKAPELWNTYVAPHHIDGARWHELPASGSQDVEDADVKRSFSSIVSRFKAGKPA